MSLLLEKNPRERVQWVDVFRGVLILSVVIGHATGLFNSYIYQWHMGAFFVISGYMGKQEKRSVIHTFIYRTCTTWLPIFSSIVVMSLLSSLIYRLGYYEILFGTLPYYGVVKTIVEFLANGSIYSWWLGATWFVLVLYAVVILQRVIGQICNSNASVANLILSFILFIYGHIMAQKGLSQWNIDLIFIAQFYYAIGLYASTFVSQTLKAANAKRKLFMCILIGFVTFFVMWGNTQKFRLTMDFPSRNFNGTILDMLLVLNGTIFVFAISQLLMISTKKINNLLQFLGRNTLPIVLFHFVGFKVATGILVILDKISISELSNIVPSPEVGNKYWWFYTITSISLSLFIWKILNYFKSIRLLLGQEKEVYALQSKRILKKKPIALLDNFINNISFEYVIRKIYVQYRKLNLAYKRLIGSAIAIFALVIFPIVRQGIILNDELQAWEYRMSGLTALIQRNIQAELGQGRPLRIMAALNSACSFLFADIWISRVVQCVIFGIAIISFGCFMWKLLGDKRLATFCSLSILVFWPITFEHATPNAFNGLVFIPIIELCCSLNLLIDYVDRKKGRYLSVSILFLLIAVLGYEFMITFVPIYLLVYIYKAQIHSFKRLIRVCVPGAAFCLLYMVTLVSITHVIGGNYDGAKIGFVSIKSSVDIIKTLIKSALPGYWLFNGKYLYLFQYYGEGQRFSLRALTICVIYGLVMALLFKDRFDTSSRLNKKSYVGCTIVALLYMIIPILPNAISKIYQGNVTADHFTSLPVTSVVFFTACFLICSFVWQVLHYVHRRKVSFIIIALFIVVILPIQTMNDIFSREQYKNYTRIEFVEKLFETDVMKSLSYQCIYAPDIYKTKNTLAIPADYFMKCAERNEIKGMELTTDKNAEYMVALYENGENEWTITNQEDEIVVLAKHHLQDQYAARISENQYIQVPIQFESSDKNIYMYHFVSDSLGNWKECDSEPFSNILRKAGSTLETGVNKTGIFEDGWITDKAGLTLQSGEKGNLHIEATYDQRLSGNENIQIYMNGILAEEYAISASKINIDIPCSANSLINLKLICNFSFQATPPDIRMLSLHLDQLFVS